MSDDSVEVLGQAFNRSVSTEDSRGLTSYMKIAGVSHACMLFGDNIDQNLDIILYIWIPCHQLSYLAFEQQLNIHS
jgi:hypothetical protein